jgi:hypothetical protein
MDTTRDDMPPDQREIALPDGQTRFVDARLYPFLMEWDWRFDDRAQQIVRTDDPSVTLYDTELRWAAARKLEIAPVLTREAVLYHFGHLPAYRELVLLSQRQRDWARWEVGYELPAAWHFVARALSHALCTYHEWLDKKGTFAFESDTSDLTPGTLVHSESADDIPEYMLLGDWLDDEMTGDWAIDREAPTGLVPEVFRDHLSVDLRDTWKELVEEENYENVKLKKLIRQLKDEDRPLWLLIDLALDVIATYPLPRL